MAFNYCNVTLVGNVSKVEEIGNGVAVSVVTSDPAYTKADGTQVAERTYWHSVKAFCKLAEYIKNTLGVGDKNALRFKSIFVSGRLTYNTVENQNGKKTYTDIMAGEVVFLNPRDGVVQNNGVSQQTQQFAQQLQGQMPPQYGAQPQYPQYPQYPQGGYPQGGYPQR